MKKTHRAMLSILLVLALLTALPLTAMAEAPDNNEPGQEISVEKGETLTTNEGRVVTNAGTITTNQVVAGSPNPRVNAGYIENNTGTVTNNVNGGYIENNQKGAVVEINHGSGTVVVTDENGDTVFEGDAPKTVEAVSTVKNNYGTVKENHSGNQRANREAGIVTNYGLVETNAQYSIVGRNAQGGIVQTNNGWVGYNNYSDGSRVEGVGNAGEVTDNYGLVFNEGGTVVNNHAQGADGCPAIVDNYSGTVVNNYGEVDGYHETNAKVTNNYGSVEGGTVETNDVGGWVEDGSIGHWDNEKQEGVTEKLVKSTVTTNYGTHVQYADVQDYEKRNEGGGTYYFGVHALDENAEKVYLGSYEYTNEVTIDALNTYAKEKGYKITGIQEVKDYSWQKKDFVDHNEAAPQNGDGAEETPGTTGLTSFRISAPTRLKLYWEKIASIFKPAASSGGGAEAVPTSYNPKYIGLGSVVTINGSRYKVVEIKDDAFVVVSFDALPDEDVQDLDALYAKRFTPEQQKLIKNVGQLLDSEDVLTVFGKPGNHPVFEISKALTE